MSGQGDHGGHHTTPAAGRSASSSAVSTPRRRRLSTPRRLLARFFIRWGALLWNPSMPLGAGRVGQHLLRIGLILAGREEFRR